ncbi:Fungal Zn(2)-Cys(6) binuclear cluster domain-containing protein [Penicillium ucsense]|uniref:Fungal Zn(2)-Cys(6) binuclear cluster domain-containing protein n=1 Tax=Penicillium ucsense TaxID=2839758 RepID=A0A8J8W8H5_9EURO|nr:Fungal Zn(2)-Cys(6) binuclear cluster domain-containing protein [Penicillium ucsense]KAF7738811.1 Fungal Zn(2)-Cys(6) binuclear cluster domain-containing protein [Penicillium ucsense]
MPRRCHTKSRKGCVQCKERHIKCDEHRPTCSLCVKRELTCTYVSPPPRRKPTTDISQPASIRSASATLSPPVMVSRLPRLEEMRLLHHALMVTSPTFIQDDIDREFWQMVVPRIATDHGYVLDGFLAVAALHLASLEPGRSSHWLETALRYQNSAIIGLRQHLATSEQNREALFSCSVLNLVFVTASPGIQGEGHPVDPLGDILTMRSFLSGTAFLFLQIYHGKEPTSIDFWIRRDRTKTVSKDCNTDRRRITINELHTFRKTFDGLHSQHQEIYHSTHDLLLKAIEGWPTEDSISWPIKVEDAFLDLVKQGDWIARIMLLFHGIGMHLMSRKWFAKGSGRRLVSGILQPLEGQIPPEWRDLIAWMRGAVEI